MQVNLVTGTFYIRIYLEIKEHVKKMNDNTLARRTQRAVQHPFEAPSVSGTRRISFMFPSNTPLAGSAPAFVASLAGGRRHWLPLPRLRIFPSQRRLPSSPGGPLSAPTEQQSLPSGRSPQNQPTVPLLDPAALNSLVPTDTLQRSSLLPAEPFGVDIERLAVIRGSSDTPQLASADSDSGVWESSCGAEAPAERSRAAVGGANIGSDIYNAASSASSGRPLSFAGIPLIDESDCEGDDVDVSGAYHGSPNASPSLRSPCPALLQLSSVEESVGPVPAVDIDGNVTLTRSTRQNRLAGAVCVMNSKARIRGKKKMEGKMAVRAVLIVVAFLAFWLPLAVCAVVSESLLSTGFGQWAAPLADLQVVTVCFCNLSVVANPVLYGLMVRQYRPALRQLLPVPLLVCRPGQ